MLAEETMTQEKLSLMELFETHKGRVVHKFPHHIELYDRLFWFYNDGRDITLLEIGLGEGGSLDIWRKFFGKKAAIIGVDIQDRSYLEKEIDAKVITGNQGSSQFWEMVKPQIGRPDIIIDDGSHQCDHQILTFKELFPILKDGGLYIIEDIHTSYRESYGGGHKHPGSSVEFLKNLVDVIHYSEWCGETNMPNLFGIRIYPNLAVIEKRDPKHWGGSTMRPISG